MHVKLHRQQNIASNMANTHVKLHRQQNIVSNMANTYVRLHRQQNVVNILHCMKQYNNFGIPSKVQIDYIMKRDPIAHAGE